MYLRLALVAVLLAFGSGGPAWADTLTVAGRVTDAAGKPVAGAEIASFWMAQGETMKAYQPTTTNDQGRFSLKLNHFGRPVAILGLDKNQKTGALFTVEPKTEPKDITVKLEPLVRVKGEFFCKEMNFKPKWTNVYMMTPDGTRILQSSSDQGAFSFLLPPGKYKFWGYGTDIKDVKQDTTLTSDAPVVDMKTVDVASTPIAKHKGKAPPKWTVTDARGVKKDFTLADYKGKWVLVDFFTHWCGPCVGRSLPNLMDLYEDHKDHRDKFEILAFHVEYAKDFADYDTKMKDVVKNTWHGKDLPFPVLLDATKETIQAFGIRAFPTTILIDPDGNLVGEVDEAELEMKLPPIPASVRVPKSLDRNLSIAIEDGTLKQNVELLARVARVDIRLDEPALAAAGVSPGEKVPLKLAGMVSLRSWLNLLLAAHNLTFTTDEKGILITSRKPKEAIADLSGPQKGCAQRINDRLGEKKEFTFKDATLSDVAAFFEQMTTENFVLDPAARKAGTLDPAAKVTGSAKDVPLRDGLQKLLDAAGMTFVVRDEVVVITPKLGKKIQK